MSRILFFDTETTGASPAYGHRVIELAVIESINGKLTGRNFHTHLNPGCPIDPFAQRVHGITQDMLVGKPVFADVAQELIRFIDGSDMVAHNAQFDTRFLDAELLDCGLGSLSQHAGLILCSLRMARKRFPGRPCGLDALLSAAGLQARPGYHSALEDTRMLAQVYFRLLANRD